MKSVVWIILTLAVCSLPAIAQSEYTPPLAGIVNAGCLIDGYQDGSFHVHVWADYQDKRLQENAQHGWIKLYSIRSSDRPSKNREKALADCNKWMDKIEALRTKLNNENKKAKAAAEAESHHGRAERTPK